MNGNVCVRAQLQMICPSEFLKSHLTHVDSTCFWESQRWSSEHNCTPTGLVHPLPYTVDGSAVERHPEVAEGYCRIWELIFVTNIPVLSCLCLSVHLFVPPYIFPSDSCFVFVFFWSEIFLLGCCLFLFGFWKCLYTVNNGLYFAMLWRHNINECIAPFLFVFFCFLLSWNFVFPSNDTHSGHINMFFAMRC